MTGWKTVQNVSPDYLIGRGSYTIIETNITSKESKEYKKVFEWCNKNSNDCWSVAQSEKYDGHITWRFYDGKTAQNFKKKFKNFIVENS